ncbi:MAG: hypothetical protein R3E12_08200 [Candidatus Eisenbacteria bacterium]
MVADERLPKPRPVDELVHRERTGQKLRKETAATGLTEGRRRAAQVLSRRGDGIEGVPDRVRFVLRHRRLPRSRSIAVSALGPVAGADLGHSRARAV